MVRSRRRRRRSRTTSRRCGAGVSSSTSSFRNGVSGWRVALAKYGESGRRVVVDSTERGSACFDGVKPGDELAAVNGAAVVDPDEESIETPKSASANAPRPLVITFIEGEDRDTLFAAQEAQRAARRDPRKAPPATKKRADVTGQPRRTRSSPSRPRRAVPRAHLRGRRDPERRQGRGCLSSTRR